MGCDVIDKIYNRGFEKGYKQGFEEGFKQGFEEGFNQGFEEGFKEGLEQVALLMRKLFAQKRIEDIRKACKDRDYFMQLMKEFGIV